jgi:formylglycine-generating enzyme
MSLLILAGTSCSREKAEQPPAQVVAQKETRTAPPQSGETMVNPKDGLTYVWIPPGTFHMGCSAKDKSCEASEKPMHEVTLTKGFWIGQTEVTQSAYKRVTGKNASYSKGDLLPVQNITWTDAEAYCKAAGMRLPTEAEWEYAAGDITDPPEVIAWYKASSDGHPHPVAEKKANQYHLYDMIGNVWEWTADWYSKDYYQDQAVENPTGPKSGTQRSQRGGSWLSAASTVRVTHRAPAAPNNRDQDNGVRCAGDL